MISTADDLLESIKQGAAIPVNQNRFTDTALLDFADEYIQGELVPELIRLKSEILTVRETVTLTGARKYLIPSRAVGRTLRAVFWDGKSLRPMEYMQWEESDGAPESIAFEGNYFLPFPTPAVGAGTLEIAYYCRPSALVKTTGAAAISGINTGLNLVQVSALPSTITNGSSVDLVRAQGGREVLAKDLTATVAGLNVTLSAALPSDLALGDYLCPAGTSPVLNMPQELANLVSKAVQLVVLEAQADAEALALAQKKFSEIKQNAFGATAPRMQGESTRINPGPYSDLGLRVWRRSLWRAL